MLASVSTVRTIDFYVLIQWADVSAFGASPGNPGTNRGSTSNDGPAFAVAYRDDGTSPWAGTTNNDGTDTKGATVWTNGGSTAHVLDRSCTPTDGSYSTNRENMISFDDCQNDYARIHMIGDADGVVFLSDISDTGIYKHRYFGIYEAREGLTPTVPLVAIYDSSTIPFANFASVFGSKTCTAYYEGGVVTNILADDILSFRTGYFDKVFAAGYQPNDQIIPPEYDEFPMFIIAEEGRRGYLGQLPTNLYGTVYNLPTNTTNPAATRAYFGTNAQNSVKVAIPWDGNDQPGTATSREGRTF